MKRRAAVERNTKETQISLELCLDGSGQTDIETGVGFFDHMLEGFARHGLFDLTVKVKGDLQVDDHHTVEDTELRWAQPSGRLWATSGEFVRFGDKILPWMRFWLCAPWIWGADPTFLLTLPFSPEKLGDMSGEMVREFFYASPTAPP